MTAIPFIDLKAQQARIAGELRRRLDGVLAHCQFILGPEVAELETELATFCGAKHCVAVSSGTDAIQIAFMAEGIGPGDAVFLPAFTYTATAEVPLVLGATPVFVDVDPRTFQMDPAHLGRRITEVRRGGKLRPRALIGVDLFGQPADWPALRRSRTEFWLHAAWQAAGCRRGRHRDQLLPVEAAGGLRRRRRAADRERRTCGAVSQPAHPRRRHVALRGAAYRDEWPAGLASGGGAARQADGVQGRTGEPRTRRALL
jgi:hypothetical protein